MPTPVTFNTVSFAGLVVGVPTSLPHGLTTGAQDLIPDLILPSVGGFTITANAVNITVTRGAADPDNVVVYAVHWHSVVRDLPAPATALVPQPFIPQYGTGGGGGNTLDQAYDQGGAGAGRVITADAGSVEINNTVNDATAALTLTKVLGGALADTLAITHGAIGSGIDVNSTNNGRVWNSVGGPAFYRYDANNLTAAIDILRLPAGGGLATPALNVVLGGAPAPTGTAVHVQSIASGRAIQAEGGRVEIFENPAAVVPFTYGSRGLQIAGDTTDAELAINTAGGVEAYMYARDVGVGDAGVGTATNNLFVLYANDDVAAVVDPATSPPVFRGNNNNAVLRYAIIEMTNPGGGAPTGNYFEGGFGSAAAVSPANRGRIRFNEGANIWEVSENGGAYVPLVGGGSGGASIYTWGNFAVGAGAGDAFLPMGGGQYEGAAPPTTELYAVPWPVAGTFDRMFVRHNGASGDGDPVVYKFLVNSVAQAPSVSLASNAVATGSDLVNSFAVAAGDLISCRAQKALGITNGTVDVMVAIRFTPA